MNKDKNKVAATVETPAEELRRKQLDAEQAWEYLQSKNVPNMDIERPGQHNVTLTELLAEFANGVYIGRDDICAECKTRGIPNTRKPTEEPNS